MCGIAGIASLSKRNSTELAPLGSAMHRALAHRGPDDYDMLVEGDAGLVLTHRRLAIIDLSPDGRQPMASPSGRYVIVYNGEIYNYRAIQADLEAAGVSFKTRSDTEVLLAAIDQWGLNRTLQKINGMFAFALWDKKDEKLHLVRDRFGKKPLYVGWAGDDVVFASELKAFFSHPDFKKNISRDVLALYMRYGYVHAPYAIFENVWQLLPGARLAISLKRTQSGFDLAKKMENYWSLPHIVDEARVHPWSGSEAELINTFEEKLKNAVAERMVSDVPLGSFLSGGIDSSLVTALMQQQSAAPVKSFSIGFGDSHYNEAPQAKKIAAHLGTEHTEFMVSTQDALGVIRQLPDIYDEPFADASAIPTFLVSQLARQYVTVALTGDGGDEILGGYDRHTSLPPLWKKIGWMPSVLRAPMASLLQQIPDEKWAGMKPDTPQFARKIRRFLSVMGEKDAAHVYERLLSAWPQGENPVLGGAVPAIPLHDPAMWPKGLNFAEKMIYGDTLSYRVNDLMVKTDRASMAVALEARAPLMDYQLCAFCWGLPLSAKIRNGQGKWLLRQVLARHVPESLFDRPKMGFNVPIGDWLRHDLRHWAEGLLDEDRLVTQGLFDVDLIQRAWHNHLAGKGDDANAGKLWSVLMAQCWFDRWDIKS